MAAQAPVEQPAAYAEGDEVHELVAALGRKRGRLEGPEHGHSQGDPHYDCEGDVEVLAHGAGVAGAPGKGKRLEVAVNVAQPCPALSRALHILPTRYRRGITPFILRYFRYSDRGYPRFRTGRSL